MRRSVILVALASLLIVPAVQAQELSGPTRGTWGAETGQLTGASLLRFRSPSTAWLLGATVLYTNVKIDTDGPFGPLERTDEATSISVRIGHRWYRNAGEQFRPFITVSPILTWSNRSDEHLGGGGSVEVGAMHFFSRRVSLGASGELRGEYRKDSQSSGPSTITYREFIATLGGVRMLAAVYF